MSAAKRTIKRLIFYLHTPQGHHAQEPLQSAYQSKMSMEDHLLHRAYMYLWCGRRSWNNDVLWFHQCFRISRSPPLWVTSWQIRGRNYIWWDGLQGRIQYMRLKGCSSVISSTGAPEGGVLTMDYINFNPEYYHKHVKHPDSRWCQRRGRSVQEPAGGLVESNQLKLNTSESEEMVLDRSEPHQQPCPSKGWRWKWR